MTNEQREAIDTLKEITENDLLNYWEGTERPYNAIQIVLSLIKEQQEKIAKYEKIYKEYDCYRWVKELDKKDKIIEFYKKGLEREIEENRENVMEIIEKDKEIDKLKKQIDLMAKFIENNMSEKKIINEICIKSKCNNEECHEDDLKDCIKQYFADLVEKE